MKLEKETMRVIAERILILLQESELSEWEFPLKIFSTKKSLDNWLDGKALPSTEVLYMMSEVYNASIDWIMGKTDVREVAHEITSGRVRT